jgi:putative transposase
MPRLPSIKAWNGDAGYRGTFVQHLQTRWQKPVHISQRIVDGFTVLPGGWLVERSFSWFNGQRRLSKDYEKPRPAPKS